MDAELQDMRGLAQRWARHQKALSDSGSVARVVVADVLTAPERERLFGWVRRRIAAALGTGPAGPSRRLLVAEDIGRSLGWENDGREPVYGYGGDAPDEMEAWYADAWTLCEAAGWPQGGRPMKAWAIMTEDERRSWAEKVRASGLGRYTVEELIEYQRRRQASLAANEALADAERALADAKEDLVWATDAAESAVRALEEHTRAMDSAASERDPTAQMYPQRGDR